MDTLKIDFNNITGKIKPMHAVNNPPTVPSDTYGLYEKVKEAHIPYVRLHDTGGLFGGAHYVDIENIFTDFGADENDPASYDFAFTDKLLESMDKIGLKPFYRLGCTIENYHKIKAYHIFPPADPYKWERICEHIILHYNEGWADGYHFGIEYWEIWNEPDNEPEIGDNPMWRGTQEEFFELYDITAKHLKASFPFLKIGGYASCGFYALSDADFSETAHSTSRVGYFVEFFHNFFKYISEKNSPLDFFSWHSYAGLRENVMYAAYAKEKLTQYGYGNAEVIFNEWNPGIHNRGKAVDASNIAAVMCAMQKTSTDMCMYYDGQADSTYCGLFSGDFHKVFKAYYAFRAFGELYLLKNEVFSDTTADGVYVCAASGEKKAAMIVNSNSGNVDIKLDTPDILQCFATDETHDYEAIELKLNDGVLTLPPYAVWLVIFE
ncbi:MAG: hypothetical protein FWF15_03985 [Oscillospiraceae bacterium]|nr:hypothetical protein [Oscillospiraceae bacterium]